MYMFRMITCHWKTAIRPLFTLTQTQFDGNFNGLKEHFPSLYVLKVRLHLNAVLLALNKTDLPFNSCVFSAVSPHNCCSPIALFQTILIGAIGHLASFTKGRVASNQQTFVHDCKMVSVRPCFPLWNRSCEAQDSLLHVSGLGQLSDWNLEAR